MAVVLHLLNSLGPLGCSLQRDTEQVSLPYVILSCSVSRSSVLPARPPRTAPPAESVNAASVHHLTSARPSRIPPFNVQSKQLPAYPADPSSERTRCQSRSQIGVGAECAIRGGMYPFPPCARRRDRFQVSSLSYIRVRARSVSAGSQVISSSPCLRAQPRCKCSRNEVRTSTSPRIAAFVLLYLLRAARGTTLFRTESRAVQLYCCADQDCVSKIQPARASSPAKTADE